MDDKAGGSQNIFVQELNPTFLYTWKGLRTRGDDSCHSHDYIELAFVLSGKGRYRVAETIYDTCQGDLIILNPKVKHQALIIDENPTPSTEFFVAFSDIWVQGEPENVLPLPNSGGCVLHTTGQLYQRMFKLCASMEAENAANRQGHYEMMKAYLMQMLLFLLREHFEPVTPNSTYMFKALNRKNVVEQVLTYFEDHYNEKISLDQIAENMYLSPFYISKIFKSETGDTPINHLIHIRLKKARELLEAGGSIQEVAAEVGYDDAYHFSKLFKKYYGVAPSIVKKTE